MKVVFVDFEDSFSYNLVQELVDVGFYVEVVSWKDFESLPTNGLLVLGPGPGHPDDYQRIFPLLKLWLEDARPFLGVCLGHQIFWRIHNARVDRSYSPLHGRKVKLLLSPDWIEWLEMPSGEDIYVQRYNSLSVKRQEASSKFDFQNFIQDDEILITRGKNFITYQFHPESIGTTFRSKFIRALYSILKE